MMGNAPRETASEGFEKCVREAKQCQTSLPGAGMMRHKA
jgi:hypothetical protein